MVTFSLSQLAGRDEEEKPAAPTGSRKTSFSLSELSKEAPLETPVIAPAPEPEIDEGEDIDDDELQLSKSDNIRYVEQPGALDVIGGIGSGLGEFMLMATTDLAGAFAGTVAATIDGALSGERGIEDAPDLINFMRDTFRYEPKTPGGAAVTAMIGAVFEQLAEAGEYAGDKAADAGLPPAVAAVARIAPEALVMLAPFALRGKSVGPLAKEVMKANKKAAVAGKKPTIFTRKLQQELEAAQTVLEEIKAKPLEQVTVAEGAAIPQLTARINEISTKLAEKHGLEYVRVTKTDSLIAKVSESEVMAADLGRVQRLVKEAGEATSKVGAEATSSAKPIEVVIDGTKTTVVGGIEELLAARMLGEKTVHVKTVLPNPKPAAVKAMAEKVNRVNEEARILSEKIKKNSQKSVMDHMREQYDLTQPLKVRLMKLLPKKEWVPVVLRYEQMQNAGTSASTFAKDFYEPIFKQVTDRQIYNRQSGGKTIAVTDRMILDEIVQSRLIVEIAKRRPKHKFDGKTTSVEHQARLRQLAEDIGPEEFGHINGLADGVFGTYKKLLDLRRNEGLISKELYEKLKNFDYAPRQHLEFFDPEIASQSDKGVRSSGVLKLRDGSKDLTEMSAGELLHDAIMRTHNIIAKNRVLAELDNAIRSNPTSALAQHVKILKTPKKKGAGIPKVQTKALEDAGADVSVSKIPNGFERVEFFNQGKKRALALDPYIASVWKTPAELEGLRVGAGILRAVTGVNVVKALAVGVNPAFPLVEIPRNMIGIGFSNNTSLSGVPLFGARSFTGQTLMGLPITAGQFARNMAAVSKDAWQHGPYFRELANNNAFPRFLAEIGLESFKSINRPEGLAGKVLTEAGSKYLNRVADAWSFPGIYAETIMRMAVARQAKLRGLSPLEQAGEALRMVNFNQVGYMTARVDSFIPFFNAGFQASRAQFRGFSESPARTAALATSVMSLGYMNYMYNWYMNPEAVQSISDEHLATGFNFVLPPTSSGIDPNGNVVHPYIHIAADGAAVVPLALAAWTMRMYNEKRRPSGLLLDAITSSTFPLLDVTGAPLADATLAVMGNFDRFRGQTLFPEETGEPYEEYYGEHEKNHTPGFYVEAGRKIWEQGLLGAILPGIQDRVGDVQDTSLEGLASPERLRAVVDAYLPAHPLSNAFSSLRPLTDPNARELYTSNWEALDKAPFVGRLLNVATAGSNAWADTDEAIGDLQATRFAAKRSVDEMAFQVAHGNMSLETAINATQTRFRDVDPEYRDTLARRVVVSTQAQKIFLKSSKEAKLGVPNHKWWATIGSLPIQKDKARAYYKTWIQAGRNGRKNMDRVLYQLSGIGMKNRILDADGEFLIELGRLKKQHGTDFEPGILLDDVDYSN